MPGQKQALLSVSDKQGVVEFAEELIKLGYQIISTGGTAKALRDNGIHVLSVSDVTGFPEILDGRVKTLHPKVHAGILAKRSKEHLEELGDKDIPLIDIVAVNLYPFEQTLKSPEATDEDIIENIDIGGPTLVRAAAKNYKYVTVAVNPARYEEIIAELKQKGEVSDQKRKMLASEAFSHISEYDYHISKYFSDITSEDEFGSFFTLGGNKLQTLRYGENPHQKAAFYKEGEGRAGTVAGAKQHQGKELSFNNIVDVEAALSAVKELERPAAVIIKHTNPCGAAENEELSAAVTRGIEADPVSAFGGIVGLNRKVEKDTAEKIIGMFFEAVIAPVYSEEALKILSKKANLRVLESGYWTEKNEIEGYDIKKVSGGFLIQSQNIITLPEDNISVVTKKEPTQDEFNDLLFAWKVVKHVKSNAIVLAKNGATLGIGAGQMNRVGSAKIALEQAGQSSRGAVMASDAFFPFSDTVDYAAENGIEAIIQPGGSVRDEDSIKAANEHNISMIFTGIRHFKH